MRYFILCCFVAIVAAKEKKISLEDIERDNLKGDKIPRTISNKTPGNYGFVPMKTINDYVRQQPKQQYLQAQPQQYFTPPATQEHVGVTQAQYAPAPQQYHAPTRQQYSSPPLQQQQQQYYYQPAVQPQPHNYQQYENVPYITDNSIAQQQPAQQYYNTPQYYYLQQYTSPSAPIHAVVDPKGGIQYVMYVPAYVQRPEQTQNYESVVYPDTQEYTEPQYISQSPAPEAPAVQYTEPQPKTRYFTTKHEPKSLLDSYVPSILQVQYYKQQQQQAQANALSEAPKSVGKIEYAKTTRPNSAESNLNYNYQPPVNAYQK